MWVFIPGLGPCRLFQVAVFIRTRDELFDQIRFVWPSGITGKISPSLTIFDLAGMQDHCSEDSPFHLPWVASMQRLAVDTGLHPAHCPTQ